ncbi:hypothetical protein L7F22_056724 [Adiantum nelumboides]|nr:hypothetical protein [Adiantum nelumboides]
MLEEQNQLLGKKLESQQNQLELIEEQLKRAWSKSNDENDEDEEDNEDPAGTSGYQGPDDDDNDDVDLLGTGPSGGTSTDPPPPHTSQTNPPASTRIDFDHPRNTQAAREEEQEEYNNVFLQEYYRKLPSELQQIIRLKVKRYLEFLVPFGGCRMPLRWSFLDPQLAREAAEEEDTGEDQEEEEIPTPDSLVSIPSGGTEDLDEIPEEVSDLAHLHRFVGALALSQKKKKDSKKEKDKAKKRKGKDKVDAEQDEIDRRIFAQLKTMGLTKLGMPERPYCTICQIFGHSDDRCWYNPNFRGRIPEHVKQKVQAPLVNEVGTGDNQPRPVNFRNWNNRGPNQRFRNQRCWMNQGNQNFQAADANAPCNYCGASGHRQGPDCSLWCKHRIEQGIPTIRYNNKPESSQQPPVQLNAVILEEMEVGTSKKWMNEAIPERSSESKLQAKIP